jgi:hypothetical protein
LASNTKKSGEKKKSHSSSLSVSSTRAHPAMWVVEVKRTERQGAKVEEAAA